MLSVAAMFDERYSPEVDPRVEVEEVVYSEEETPVYEGMSPSLD